MRCKWCHEDLWFGGEPLWPDAYRDKWDHKTCFGAMVVPHRPEISEVELSELAVIALTLRPWPR